MKLAHIADTHIKNLKYHFEYRKVFEQLYAKLKEENVDYIIHCGDIAHTKTQISPEFVELCTDFFRNLAAIAPTYIILGNHDGNLKNSSRQDALTPIADALNCNRLHLLKNSGEVIVDDSLTLNVLSVFDQDNWVVPSDDSKINIALYHGAISGVSTDIGWVMDHGEHDVGIFEGHDYAFLGDIHKTNQVLDHEGRVRYCGSTVQQNHGETNDKGFLIWDIQSKDDFTVKHHVLKNPKPFITIELTPKGRMPRGISVPTGARLRLVSNNNLPLTQMKRALDVAKHRFSPEAITFLNRAAGQRSNVEEFTDNLKVEDLRNLGVQEKLIREYLKDYEVDESLLEKVISLNAEYNKIVEQTEEVGRNVNWKIHRVEWDNLFNYGEGNSIEFTNLNGIIGIFGKNYSGKSSVIDSILYTMFNTTSKNERKNLNIINQNRPQCRGMVEISVDDVLYRIERTSEKYTKKLKGEVTLEAKTDLDFKRVCPVTGDVESLNGLSRIETDKNIRKHFGTLEDFLLSAMASQHGALQFINEGSTRRKEIFAKFLDLEIFEQKFKLAKEDASDTRGALRRLEGRNYKEEIETAQFELQTNNEELRSQKTQCNALKSKIETNHQKINEIDKTIESIPAEIIDVVDVKTKIKNARMRQERLIQKNTELSSERTKNQTMYSKIIQFLDTFDIHELERKQEEISTIRDEISAWQRKRDAEQLDLERYRKKQKLLATHEYDPNCEYCSNNEFVKDAIAAQKKIPASTARMEEYLANITTLNVELEKLMPAQVEKHVEKYYKVVDKKATVSAAIADLNLEMEKNKLAKERLYHSIKELNSKLNEYNQNKEAIENLEELTASKASLMMKGEDLADSLDVCEEKIISLVRTNGSLEQKVESIKQSKQDYIDLQDEFAAYDLFMRCMHSNGIAYDVIKRKLPVVNQEIAKVLANITNFEIYFEDNGKKFELFIKHPKHEPRPLDMGSGAEKTIAAMSIRLALLSVSSLPKGDIFILDEPGTALDEDNMEGFIRILELIKMYFKNILLISHLDSLKDCADVQIMIDKREGYAKINH